MFYAKVAQQQIVNRERDNNKKTSFSTYTKKDILNYLKSPEANAKNLRNASKYMFVRSPQYRRLCLFYAMVPMWCYTLAPSQFDPSKIKGDTFKKQYFKTAALLESMNIKHEMQKACAIAWTEGIFYGISYSAPNSFFLQKVDPDICNITSVLDGVYSFSIDMSRIQQDDLFKYPDYITTMWNTYKSTNIKWQDVPEEYSWCIKIDESVSYPCPPFASVLPNLFDIDTYSDLQEERSEIENYKAISMKVPVDEYGAPTIDMDIATKYYEQVCNNISKYIGVILSPFDIKDWDFQKSGGIADIDIVSRAEEQFWSATGTSSLLFGSTKNNSSLGMKLSIAADESVMIAVMNQCERLINRYLKNVSSTSKFRINLLPVTIYNQEDMVKKYKDAASYGIPVKSVYGALMGLSPADMLGMDYVEREILQVENLVPMVSSHTISSDSDDGGRPTAEESGEEISDAGEATRNQK